MGHRTLSFLSIIIPSNPVYYAHGACEPFSHKGQTNNILTFRGGYDVRNDTLATTGNALNSVYTDISYKSEHIIK